MLITGIRKCSQCKRPLEVDDNLWCKQCKENEKIRNKRKKENRDLRNEAMSLFGIKRNE